MTTFKIPNIDISKRNPLSQKSLRLHPTWTAPGFLVMNEISEIIQRSIPATFINHAETYCIILNNQLQSAAQITVWAVPSPTLTWSAALHKGLKSKDEKCQHNEDERKPRPWQSRTAQHSASLPDSRGMTTRGQL